MSQEEQGATEKAEGTRPLAGWEKLRGPDPSQVGPRRFGVGVGTSDAPDVDGGDEREGTNDVE